MSLLRGLDELGVPATRVAGVPERGSATWRGYDALINLDLLHPIEHPRVITYTAATGRQTLGRPRYGWEQLSSWEIAAALGAEKATYQAARMCAGATPWATASIVADYGIDPVDCVAVGIGPSGVLNDGSPVRTHRSWDHPRFAAVLDATRPANLSELQEAFALLRQVHPRATLEVLTADLDPLPAGLTGASLGAGIAQWPGIDGEGSAAKTGGSAGRVLSGASGNVAARVARRRFTEQSTCLIVLTSFDPVGQLNLASAAHGVPSIVVADGGAADVLGEGSRRVEPGDVAALAAAMREICEPETAQAAAEAARQRAVAMTWPRVVARLLQAVGVWERDPADWLELFGPSRSGRSAL